MPLVDDLIAEDSVAKEVFSSPGESLKVVTIQQARAMFPDVQITDSPHLFHFPFKLCSSFPKRNVRGRTFLPEVLSNSFASLTDQLIDVDHMLDANGQLSPGPDRIVGFVKATRFSLPERYEFKPQNFLVETAATITLPPPVPVLALGTLFSRAKGVKPAVAKHMKGEESWKVSMECGHKWKEAYFLYRNHFIPLSEAEVAMKDCVRADSVLQYKGHELTVCLGGLNNKVDFWGVAITQNPADDSADILNFFGGSSPELSSKKIFHVPLHGLDLDNEVVREAANIGGGAGSGDTDGKSEIDFSKLQSEFANVEILGETEPTDDGHKHFILSNALIVPTNGHTHYVNQFNISRGTNPTYTGVTDVRHDRLKASGECTSCGCGGGDCGCVEWQHMHLIRVPLKGKFRPDDSSEDTSQIDSLLESEEEMAKAKETLSELLAKLDASVERFTKAGDDASRKSLEGEIATTRKEIAAIQSQQDTDAARQEWLNEKVAKGEFLSKEKADQLVADAEKKKQEELDAKLKEEQTRNARLNKVVELGINLDQAFNDVKDSAGQPLTIRRKLEMIPCDGNGETMFNMDYQLLQSLAQKTDDVKKADEAALAAGAAAASAAAANAGATGAAGTEAANKNPLTSATQKKLRNVLSVASAGAGGGTLSSEAANEGEQGGDTEEPKSRTGRVIPKTLRGKSALRR